jgi:hypothetical protein
MVKVPAACEEEVISAGLLHCRAAGMFGRDSART